MSVDVDAALGGAEALELVVVLVSVPGFSMSICLSCCACIMCIFSGEQMALLCAAPLLQNIVLLGKIVQQSGGRASRCVVVLVGFPL